MVSSTTYLKTGIKPSKSGLKEAMLKDKWREKLVTVMIDPVVLKCCFCFCFLEHVHISVLFLPHTVTEWVRKGSWSTGHRPCPAGSGLSAVRETAHPLWAGCPSARSLHRMEVLPRVQMELPGHQLLPLFPGLPCYIKL